MRAHPGTGDVIDVARDLERMQDYIVGRLPEEERRAFEERLMRDPGLVRELDQSLLLREGLAVLREEGYFARPVSRFRAFQSWVPTLAAAAVAGVALLFLWSRSAGPEPLLMGSIEPVSAGKSAPWVAAHFTFVSMRGSSATTLDLPASGLVEFRALPAAHAEGSRYHVTLTRQGDAAAEPVGDLAGLTLGEDGYVHAYADTARLTAGRYVLHVEGTSGSAESFPFTLRASATQAH